MKHLSLLLVTLIVFSAACTNREGVTPLMETAKTGDIAEVQQLISRKVNLNEQSKYGWTALMFAAREGHAQVIELLLDAGANPNLESQRIAKATTAAYPQTTALQEAIKSGHLAIANTLIDRGAIIDQDSVALAGRVDDIALLEKMHERGADFNLTHDSLYSPSALQVASRDGKLEQVKWLINHGADPNLVASGSSALLGAFSGDHPEVVQYLIDSGADPNLVVGPQKTIALLWAAIKYPKSTGYHRNLQVIRILLAHRDKILELLEK